MYAVHKLLARNVSTLAHIGLLISWQHMLDKCWTSGEAPVPSKYTRKIGWSKCVKSEPVVANEPVCLDRNCNVGDSEIISEHVVLRSFIPQNVVTRTLMVEP